MDKLEHHQLPIAWWRKTEALSESPEIYREKVSQGNETLAALYELALASDVRTGPEIRLLLRDRGKPKG